MRDFRVQRGDVVASGIDWQTDLRARGYRLTPQRQLVLQAVDVLGHSTPDDILTEVRRTATGVNISTVYRTLDLLEELKLVTHAHLGHGAPTYHLADRDQHMHLVCRDCDRVTETDVSIAAPFVESLKASHGFETDVKHFAIFGRCVDCARKRSTTEHAAAEHAATGHAANQHAATQHAATQHSPAPTDKDAT